MCLEVDQNNLYTSALIILNSLNAELNPICHLLALLGAHHILHVSRIRVNLLLIIFTATFVFGATDPQWARASSFTRFLDHTQRRTTVGRTPLDEWSARRRDLYLTTQHSQQTDIHAPGGIWTHDLSRRAAADLRLRPRGHTIHCYVLQCSEFTYMRSVASLRIISL